MNILGWDHWHVLAVESRTHDYLITAERDAGPSICVYCGSSRIHRHDTKHQLFMDTPLHGKRVGICVLKKRYQCQVCHRGFYETLPEMHPDHFMTLRLVDYIEREAMRRTFTSLAEDIGIDEKSIRLIFTASMKQQESQAVTIAPHQLGIDEVKIAGAMRCVLTDIEKHTILDILPDRKKRTLVAFLLQLPGHTSIESVTMDMWSPYRVAVSQVLPQATIVVDKFHVFQLVNRSLEVVRKNVRASLSPAQRRTLMHDRFILLHRKADLTASQLLILEAWIMNIPALGTAYELKESFCALWKAASRDEALALYQAWQQSIPTELVPSFQPLLTAMTNWQAEIFAHFDTGLTNAYAETLNGIVKSVVHQTRGASFEVIRAKLRFHAGLHLPPRPIFTGRSKPRKARASPGETSPISVRFRLHA